jgi:phosphatidylglycerophosphate synthase
MLILAMQNTSYHIINGITIYRIAATPLLFYLIFTGRYEWFSWLLPVSFFTDLIDGFLARKYKVTSVMGSRLDSIGDDLTVLAAVVAMFVFRPDFIKEHLVLIVAVLAVFGLQVVCALFRYGKITSFHTYGAKTAALLQGIFLISAFLLPEPVEVLFYTAMVVTLLELIEEIVMVIVMPEWRSDVKSLYHAYKDLSTPTRL